MTPIDRVYHFEQLSRDCETTDENGNTLTEEEFEEYIAACESACVIPILKRNAKGIAP